MGLRLTPGNALRETLTVAPMLPCRDCGGYTNHTFARTTDLGVRKRKDGAGRIERLGYELLYSCDDCGLERRWGVATKVDSSIEAVLYKG